MHGVQRQRRERRSCITSQNFQLLDESHLNSFIFYVKNLLETPYLNLIFSAYETGRIMAFHFWFSLSGFGSTCTDCDSSGCTAGVGCTGTRSFGMREHIRFELNLEVAFLEPKKFLVIGLKSARFLKVFTIKRDHLQNTEKISKFYQPVRSFRRCSFIPNYKVPPKKLLRGAARPAAAGAVKLGLRELDGRGRRCRDAADGHVGW